MKTLSQIAAAVPGMRVVGDGDVVVLGITHDSRSVQPGDIFAALKGENVDGTRFVESATANGAVAVLCDAPLDIPLPQLVVTDVRMRLGEVAAACFDHPARALRLIGITGTNGKTTITYLVESILQHAAMACGVMGTVEYRFGTQKWHADHTTPEATVVQSIMRKMVDAGANALAMEVSSHGLSLGRLNGCEFDVVAFTNLTQDHLDFHHTMEEYADAKMRLFTEMIAHRLDVKVVINLDDLFSKKIIESCGRDVISISSLGNLAATLYPVSPPEYSISGTVATIQTPDGEVKIQTGLCGAHNLNNLLVAFGICRAMGISNDTVQKAAKHIPSVPGRLERVPCDLGFSIFVDYAHTPDALVNVLRVLKPMTPGRLICVFGCGGDRDGAKRPIMGAAVAQYADIAIVTSDNPRTEEPKKIISMVLPGVQKFQDDKLELNQLGDARNGYIAITERREAIARAIQCAGAGDAVLLAGKGHEDYVIIGREKFHFDDREEAAIAVKKRKENAL
ncbi:MAG: UDP-N-acetylmuramoyl-L-alanyl-D-glutamate--2,6-diaminopimelate ligase [Deltaproteobacteria bacterium]|nr:UDP-N-acetylmuramoyl-L-alanyl-D-glutamate--2,6-diaminopimelate ligase [Deltaproteobacteria bacterium]